MKTMYKSSKIYQGFSTCFRQWRAEGTHCKYLHGYAVSFKVTFIGALDERNWVWDFGGLKRSKSLIDGMNAKDWMDFMFDHTTIVAKDDPSLEQFRHLDSIGVIRLRILDAVGAEQFARFLFEKLDAFVRAETNERVRIEQVEFFENDKNSASYCLS